MSNDKWSNNEVQFARLLCELEEAGAWLTSVTQHVLASMDITLEQLTELQDRATKVWDEAKEQARAEATILATRQDVLDLYGVKDEKGLSRAIYKSTCCGAWARFGAMERRFNHRHERCTAQYAKVDGVWQLVALANEDGTPVEFSSVHPDVLTYFWPPEVDMQEWFEDRAAGASTWTATETIPVSDLVAPDALWIGSIVEGSDAEVHAAPLPFPFSLQDLRGVIAYVEDEASLLWSQANEEDEPC